MEETVSGLLNSLETKFTAWLAEFEKTPIKASAKAFLILYLIKWAKKKLL